MSGFAFGIFHDPTPGRPTHGPAKGILNMKHVKRTLAVRALGFAAGLLVTGAAALAQQVNLQVNVPAGTTYQFQSQESVDLNMQMMMQGMPPQQMQQQIASRTGGSLKVLESQNGKPSKVEVTFDAQSGGQVQGPMGNQQIPFALAGQTVTATIDPQGNVSLQPAGNADPATMQAISQIVTVDEELFPGRPVGPGDSWQVNAADLLDAAGAQGSVNVRFDGVQNLAGRQVAVLQTQTQMQGMDQGMQTRVEMAGPVLVDLETGLVVKVDLQGQMNLSGQQQQQGMVANVEGTGQMRTGAQITNLQTGAGGGLGGGGFGDGGLGGGGMGGDLGGGGNVPQPPANNAIGTYAGDGLTFVINPDQSVSIDLNGQKFQGQLQQFDGQNYRGQFNAAGSMFDFSGTINGNNATFTTGQTTYNLTKQGGGGGGGNNPLG
ncbi:MAG: hypothetical protein AAGD32_04215 [Planctomycetota bacterium]